MRDTVEALGLAVQVDIPGSRVAGEHLTCESDLHLCLQQAAALTDASALTTC